MCFVGSIQCPCVALFRQKTGTRCFTKVLAASVTAFTSASQLLLQVCQMFGARKVPFFFILLLKKSILAFISDAAAW